MRDGNFVLHHSKQRKGKSVYVYFMIAWYFRKNGKPFRDIIKHLWRLSEYEVQFYKNSIACLNKKPHVLPCNINEVFVRESSEYLSCAIGIHFWNYWELSAIFKKDLNQKEVSTADLSKILTILRLVPCPISFLSILGNLKQLINKDI